MTALLTKIKRRSWPEDKAVELGLHPVLNRVLLSRGIETSAQLDYRLALIHRAELSGLDTACDVLEQCLQRRDKILIVGDFDTDGATSTALAVRALRAMGAETVDYLVPNRFQFGYGLSPEIVEVAARAKPGLIITVDNGISSIEGVAAANRHGIPVIITDHHLPGETLPDAAAIINPNLSGESFPSKYLAGVGVIFYLLLALRQYLRCRDWFSSRAIPEPNLAQWLDLVALGTVADVVPLDHNNRILVSQGMRRIRAERCVPGIKALAAVAKRETSMLRSSDLGFVIAPRLNAAGRLQDMAIGIECLLTDDAERAHQLAAQLDQINRERQQIEQEMKAEAFAELEKLDDLGHKTLPAGLCLYQPHWHQGVVGILAARVKEKLHRPVAVFADDGEYLKGSVRSVPGLHVRDVLAAIDAGRPGLIGKFGGHAMAAGLSLPKQSFAQFKQAFASKVQDELGSEVGNSVLWSDGELTAAEMNTEFASLLQSSGPWGQGFPEPLFDGVFELLDRRIVGERHLRMTLAHSDCLVVDAIAFNESGEGLNSRTRFVKIAYRLEVNTFRNRQCVQLVVQWLQPYDAVA